MPHNSDLARYLLYKNPWEYGNVFEGSQVCTGGVHALRNPTTLANATVPATWEPTEILLPLLRSHLPLQDRPSNTWLP